MDRRKTEHAEGLAAGALGWLAGDEELLLVFLQSTGTAPEDLKSRRGDPELLAAVIDFVLMDDAWVMSCAAHVGIPPQDLATIRASLPGGDLPHWT